MHLQFTTSDGQVIMFTIFTAFTRFKIMRPSEPKDLNLTKVTRKVKEDEDGDLSPPRKIVAQDDCDVITIGTGTLVSFNFFCVLGIIILVYQSVLHHHDVSTAPTPWLSVAVT